MFLSTTGNRRATVLGRNAAAILASRVVTAVGNLLLAVVVAGRLGSDGFGTFAALVAGVSVANLAVSFGMDQVIIRAVAAERADAAQTVRQALRFQLFVSLVLIVLATLIVVTTPATAIVVLAATALLPMGVTTVASAILRGAQRMTAIPLAAVAGSLTMLLGAAVVSDRVWPAIAAVVIGHVVNAAILTGRALGHWPGGPAARSAGDAGDAAPKSGSGLGPLVSESWVFALATLASAILAQGGLILFEALGDVGSGGLAAGVRLVDTARFLPASIFAALFPAMFDGVHRSPRYRWLFLATVLYAVVAIGLLFATAPWLARILFDDPPDGALAIRIMAIGLLATVVRLRYSFELIAVGRERVVLLSAVCTAVAGVVGYGVGSLANDVAIVAGVQVAALAVNALLLAAAAHRTGERPTEAIG